MRQFSLGLSLVISLFVGPLALATIAPVPVEFVSAVGQQLGPRCGAAIESGNGKCFAEAESSGMAAASAAQAGSMGVEGSAATAGQSADNSLLGTMANSNGERLCEAAKTQCSTVCAEVAKELADQKIFKEQQAKLKEASDPVAAAEEMRQAGLITQDLQKVTGAKATCVATFEARRGEFAIARTGSAAKVIADRQAEAAALANGKGTSTVGTFLENNWDKLGLGALGIAAIVSNNNDGGGNSENSTETAAELAAAAAADPSCQTVRSYEFAHCQKYLKSLCAIPAQMEDSRCKTFSDYYCGLSNTDLDTKAAPATPEGLGTQLCADTMAHGYCLLANKASCYSCLSLRDKSSSTCQAQPAACVRTPTDSEMVQFKTTCPDDPVFTDPKWAHIQVTTTTTTAAVTGSSIMGSGLGTSRATASVALPLDVAPVQGTNALALSSQTIQMLCARGALNNCGTRQY